MQRMCIAIKFGYRERNFVWKYHAIQYVHCASAFTCICVCSVNYFSLLLHFTIYLYTIHIFKYLLNQIQLLRESIQLQFSCHGIHFSFFAADVQWAHISISHQYCFSSHLPSRPLSLVSFRDPVFFVQFVIMLPKCNFIADSFEFWWWFVHDIITSLYIFILRQKLKAKI